MVDKNTIQDLLVSYFSIEGKTIIDEDGTVNVPDGIVRDRAFFANGKLPVKFGHVHDFRMEGTNLSSFHNFPHTCHILIVPNNELSRWDGCPQAHTILAGRNHFTNLKGVWKGVHELRVAHCPLQHIRDLPEVEDLVITFDPHLPMLPALKARHVLINRPDSLAAPGDTLERILNKYCGTQNPGDVLRCASELNEAGLEGNAEW